MSPEPRDVLHVGALVEQAVGRAGSDDFGADTWQPGLEVLVRSFNEEASLTELGEQVVTDQIVGFLANRLEVERWYTEHPEIDEERIEAPLFGLGFPRTGSTALSFLLVRLRRPRQRTAIPASPGPRPASTS